MIDTHVHLDDKRYNGTAAEIVGDFETDGIEYVINASYDRESLLNGIGFADKFQRVYASIGMHPHDAKGFDEEFMQLMRQYAKHPKVVSVGEVGLDYFYDHSPRQVQRDVFAAQIELADEFKLPLMLHIREAYGDAVDILTAQKRYLNSGVLWHCYSGSAELAQQMAKLGHFFAFGGVITFKNSKKADVILSVPKAQVLSETDCPYMTPEPHRGQLNYPKYVRLVTERLAQIYGESVEKMESIIRENCRKFFKKI
jgi:TatD DNase family protein